VPTSKAERLLDLVIALLNTRYYRSATWIRERVAGYDDAASDEAFSRMFERDKQELRDLGIPIETDPSGDGYRIRPGEFALPEMSFTAAESAALAVASRLWDTTVLGEAGSAALRKLRDAGDLADDTEADGGGPAGGPAGGPGGGPEWPLAGVQARLRTAEPAFADLFAAIRARRAVPFDYRTAAGAVPEKRSLEPWGLVSYRGSWYVVGMDTVRDAPRTFRLSRITGAVKAVGRSGAVTVPPDVQLKERVVASAGRAEQRSALLQVRAGRAAGLRRWSRTLAAAPAPDGFDQIQVPMPTVWDTARRVAGYGPDVLVIDPPELRDAVLGLLRGTVGAVPGHPDGGVSHDPALDEGVDR
jgi:predicted DNA-binding transcriptional regulator YafY